MRILPWLRKLSYPSVLYKYAFMHTHANAHVRERAHTHTQTTESEFRNYDWNDSCWIGVIHLLYQHSSDWSSTSISRLPLQLVVCSTLLYLVQTRLYTQKTTNQKNANTCWRNIGWASNITKLLSSGEDFSAMNIAVVVSAQQQAIRLYKE